MSTSFIFELNENNDHNYFSFLFLGVDTKLKFTLEPSLGQNGFQQVIGLLSSGLMGYWAHLS